MAGLGGWLKKNFGPAARQDRQLAIDILAPQIKAACLSRNFIAYHDDKVVRNSAAELIDHVAKERAAVGGVSVTYSRSSLIAQIVRDGGRTNYGLLMRNGQIAKTEQAPLLDHLKVSN